MTNIDFTELLHDVATEIHSDSNFTDDFKEFTRNSILIFKLCEIFEKGTKRKITENNITDKIGILNFIRDTIPFLEHLGLKIEIEDKMINALIRDCYLKKELI